MRKNRTLKKKKRNSKYNVRGYRRKSRRTLKRGGRRKSRRTLKRGGGNLDDIISSIIEKANQYEGGDDIYDLASEINDILCENNKKNVMTITQLVEHTVRSDSSAYGYDLIKDALDLLSGGDVDATTNTDFECPS